ncbi:MAG: metallophosphoesterase [Sulfobacillus benefaciens]|jgi:DNA repair exonuclease SbcCD nuclease subunit|uniref:Metallophosphoesterase n=1 Tax=Sulfobacillus benefaciens TaxID=453960 RepID=A0A2T2WZE4_9FIRM|nr:MAG: metallophosphoesterase [Sulfobacillus benefaciens]
MFMALTIVHLSDLHWDTTLAGNLPEWENLCQALRIMHPDLVIITGDLSSTGSHDEQALLQVRFALDEMELEYLVVAGNHDLGANSLRGRQFPWTEAYEDVPWTHTHFYHVFRQPPVVRWNHLGVTILAFSIRQHDPDNTLALLESYLKTETAPVLAFGHYPLIPVSHEGPLATFGGHDYLGGTLDDLHRLFSRFPQVQLYGCGHVHAASRRHLFNQTWQISAGAMGPGASQFWIYQVAEGQLAYFSVLGNGPLTFWEAADTEQPLVQHLDHAGMRLGIQPAVARSQVPAVARQNG